MVKRDDGNGASTDIMVVPVGTVDNEVAVELAAALAEVFNCRVERGERLTLPARALNHARGQYLSSAILAVLQQNKPGNVSHVLGVTDCDLYLPPLNFAFGEADHKGGVAVISVTRLREEFYGHPGNDQLFRRRIITEGVHEVGHVLGLEHCPDPHCVMHFSNTLADTDRKGTDFCANCRKELRYLACFTP
ncbi:MAG: archaemetzincin family Zn-dependent metalloprotease [Deltaproteobacteria bacterium]|nr:archaemetzincin family Zn-dependent metalloprotease [Deltaproteobacteria bacterium]